jgi:phage FluMu protein Com
VAGDAGRDTGDLGVINYSLKQSIIMQSSRRTGGLAHVRYDHLYRARVLHACCPKCGALANAKKNSELEYQNVLIGDLSKSWNLKDWEVRCTSCPKILENIDFIQLPPLFFKNDILEIWAWNKDHLAAILDYLQNNLPKDHPYTWLMTYIPKSWKRHKNKAIKTMREMLDG